MSWPEDLYRGIPIRRAETWPEYLRRREEERRWAPAKAMSARQGQDRNGLGATPASAVGAADLPNSTPETPQVQP